MPAHTVAEPTIDPPTEGEVIVIVASEEFVGEQVPLATTARYFVVVTRFVAVYVTAVLAMSVELAQLSVEYCHLVMVPV